jgi:plastocyanin
MSFVRFSVGLLAIAFLGAGCAAKTPSAAVSPELGSVEQVADVQAVSASTTKQAETSEKTSTTPAEPKAAPRPAKKPSPSQPAAVSVLIGDTAFSPDIQVVQAGGTVIFTNKSSKNHTVHSVDSNLYDSGNIPPGKSWKRVFPATGSYHYYTATDVNMRGIIIVR